MTLTAKGEKKLTQSTKVADFDVANFAVLYMFGAQAVINGMSIQVISEGSELSPKGYHAEMSNAITLTTKSEQIFTQGTKVTGFNVDNFAVLHMFRVQAVINGMSLQASSEGSKQSPKVHHEGVHKAMTLTTKGEQIFTQGTKVTGFNNDNCEVWYLLVYKQ